MVFSGTTVLLTSEQPSTEDYPHSSFLDMMRDSLHFSNFLLLAWTCFVQGRPSIPDYSFSGHAPRLGSRNTSLCRCMPSDSCWPSPGVWTAFNQSLGGKLVATIPIASSCHDDSFGPFDPLKCSELRSAWFLPETHLDTSSAPHFTNNSCNPFLPRSASCSLGNYISYAVNASDATDFRKTIEFVRDHDIRLTIRNTGHDYNGKATGAGAVAIWTHHMKSMQTLDYRSTTFTGKAIKMGAGVQTEEAYRYAHTLFGLLVVGAFSPTVGIVGGYTQGGGHGPLASRFGLAADQALEWEVVTASGEHVTASPSHNSDLYWALSGGGGGTYAAVVSLTVKAYPELKTSAANLTFSKTETTHDGFWRAVRMFQESLPDLVDMGAYASFFLTNDTFSVAPIQGPGVGKIQLQQALSATLSCLDRENILYNFSIAESPLFYDSHRSFDVPVNASQLQIGGRLIPRLLVQNNNSALIQAQKAIVDSGIGAVISGVCVNVSIADSAINSVNPVWRTALFDAVIGTPYSYTNDSSNILLADMTTNTFLPLLADLTPNGGAYINEADFQQPDFQTVLYGVHYRALKAIKMKYDPRGIFYGVTAVGSEDWFEDATHGGRLCRIS